MASDQFTEWLLITYGQLTICSYRLFPSFVFVSGLFSFFFFLFFFAHAMAKKKLNVSHFVKEIVRVINSCWFTVEKTGTFELHANENWKKFDLVSLMGLLIEQLKIKIHDEKKFY